jgi:hypothetical protein
MKYIYLLFQGFSKKYQWTKILRMEDITTLRVFEENPNDKILWNEVYISIISEVFKEMPMD